MRCAVRQSPNITGDLARGWSAWMGLRAVSLEALIEMTPDFSEYDLAEAWERWDGDDRESFLLDYCERKAGTWVPSEDEAAPAEARWCWWAHDGLACYGLEAEDEAGALIEARETVSRLGLASGQGDMTVGQVVVVAGLGNDWWLLGCDDYSPEP